MKDIKKFLVCGGGMMGSAIAQILAGLDDAEVTVYDVYPVDVEAKVRNNMKLLVEKGIVTEADVDKIDQTGGIVQGMSGSPIIQNGKLVGAVTHVLVNDRSRIFTGCLQRITGSWTS